MLVVVGTLFAVTAFAYGVMAFTAVQRGPIRPGATPGQRLLVFLDQHGTWILAGELALLAIATVGAIGSDRYWDERAARRNKRPQAEIPAAEAAGSSARLAGDVQRATGDRPRGSSDERATHSPRDAAGAGDALEPGRDEP